ncbi:MAG: helix-turn-helix transcriptional regulator, partial [Kamptonema sp. SIO4C4]|nr:helix-turn-helix transcriptional regulator [Kamptonema sp. SIO4C4]
SMSLRPGLSLIIRYYQPRDRLIIRNHPREHPIEFGFVLAGSRQDEYGNHFTAGQNILVNGFEPGGQVDWFSKQSLTSVSIHIESELLRSLVASSLKTLPNPLQHYIARTKQLPYFCLSETTPAMQIALSQMLHCPYRGITKQIYLESKTLELIALKLEQLLPVSWDETNGTTCNPSDIESIHHAKEILLTRLENPPSLVELSRQVGLNDRKLKEGFRHVFGTTVFGYLNNYRMEQARSLLEQKDLAIGQTARAVGYGSVSAFSTAFRRKFGISPRAYRQGNQTQKSPSR